MTELTENNEFPFSVSIRDKEFKYRSWKIKDKRAYLSVMNKSKNAKTREERDQIIKDLREALVLTCLSERTPITPDEYQYLLLKIRSRSVSHTIELKLDCPSCKETYDYVLDLDKSIKPVADVFDIIRVDTSVGTLKFKMDRIPSQEVYDDYMSKSESEFESLFVDFVQHVHSINDKSLSSDDKFKFFNNVDVNVFEDIFTQWEKQRFKVDNVTSTVCPSCSHVEEFEIDDIPAFFPVSWTE